MPIILATGRPKQEDIKFKGCPSYTVITHLKTKNFLKGVM